MVLSADTRDRIARHWAERLGCSTAALCEPGATIAEGPTDRTVRLVQRDDTLVVVASEGVRDALVAEKESIPPQIASAAGRVERVLTAAGVDVEGIHGPYALAYADGSTFSPVESDARLLVGADEAAFERLRERVPDDEWARASPAFRPGQTAGLFEDDELAAVATLTHLPFPDVGVVVAPEHRGRGYGRAVVSAITETAFDADADAIVRYRTASPAAERLAESLGYERWGSDAVVVLGQGTD